MGLQRKRASDLTPADFQRHPVWEFINDDQDDETGVIPVVNLPVASLACRIVGTCVKLGAGGEVWGLLGNIDANNPHWTEQFLAITIYHKGKSFHLARYHDVDYARNGPLALSRFLGLEMEHTFPISYDVTHHVAGKSAALVGKILQEPRIRLTEDELIELALTDQ